MAAKLVYRSLILALLSHALCFADPPEAREVALTLGAGAPLHVTIEEKTPIREGEPVRAVTTHPVYAFDREVLPAGTAVLGRVAEVVRPSAKERTQTYLAGRLRMWKQALIELDSVELPDGTVAPISTAVAAGAPGMIRLTARTEAPPEEPAEKDGLVASAKNKIKASVTGNELVQAFQSRPEGSSVAEEGGKQAKRAASGKWRAVRTALLSYWPVGRQHLRPGASFTAELVEPLSFGMADVGPAGLARVGSPPPEDAVVEARLLETVSSETAEVGSLVRAEVTRPLFSPEGHLLWPQGSVIVGEVTQVKPARRVGRNGQLRFRFTRIELPSGVSQLVAASLDAAEVDSRSRMELDSEGGASLKTSKKRFILPAISAVALMTGVPGDEDGVPTGSSAQGMAPGWTSVGPWGSLIALSSRAAAAPLGVWGTASSVYFNLVRKADELEFPEHTQLEIRFGRTPENELAAAETEPAPEPAEPEKDREPRKLIAR